MKLVNSYWLEVLAGCSPFDSDWQRMASDGASPSCEAGAIRFVEKHVSRPVQLVPDLERFWIYEGTSTINFIEHDYLHITHIINSSAVDKRQVRRIVRVVRLSLSHLNAIDQEHDSEVINFFSGIHCEFKFEDAWARDAELGDQSHLCHFSDCDFRVVNEEVVLY